MFVVFAIRLLIYASCVLLLYVLLLFIMLYIYIFIYIHVIIMIYLYVMLNQISLVRKVSHNSLANNHRIYVQTGHVHPCGTTRITGQARVQPRTHIPITAELCLTL